jgi:hypothetical protein
LAATVEDKGRVWLDDHKDPPEMNVSGTWNSDEWGALHLNQAEGSRDVSGIVNSYFLTGVVSKKQLFLLFHTDGGSVELLRYPQLRPRRRPSGFILQPGWAL